MSRPVVLPRVPDVLMFLSTTAGQAISPFVPLYAANLGLNTSSIGLLVGAGGITALIGSLLVGAWLGSAGPRRLVLIGAVVSAGGLSLVGLRPSIAALFGVLPLVAALGAIIAISAQTMVLMRTDPARADHSVGMHAFYTSLGLVVGPLLGSSVVRAVGDLSLVFLVGAIGFGISAVVALAAPERGAVETSRPQPYLSDILSISSHARLAVTTVLVAEFCYLAWTTFFPLALRSAGRSPEFIGLVFAVQGAVVALVRPGLAALTSRFSRTGVLALAFFLNAGGLLAATAPRSGVLTLACAVLFGLGVGLAFPVTMLLVSEGATGTRLSRLLSLRFVAMMAGQVLGPVATGLVAAWSVTGALAGVGGVSAAAGFGVVAFLRSRAFLDTRKSTVLP
jgi:MFS family permease